MTAKHSGAGHGLTLVHFSAQPEPFWSQKQTLEILITPQHPLEQPQHGPYAHPLFHRKRLR